MRGRRGRRRCPSAAMGSWVSGGGPGLARRGAAGFGTETCSGREPCLRGELGKGSQVSRVSQTRRARLGRSRCSGRGRRERWNRRRYSVRGKMPGPGTLQRLEQGCRSWTRTGQVLGQEEPVRGPGAAAVGHLDNPRGYSGGRGKRGGALTRGCGRNCPGWTDSKEGDIAEVQRTECSVLIGSCQGGVNEEWAEGSLRGALGPGTLLGLRRNEGCSG